MLSAAAAVEIHTADRRGTLAVWQIGQKCRPKMPGSLHGRPIQREETALPLSRGDHGCHSVPTLVRRPAYMGHVGQKINVRKLGLKYDAA
jgi:hypothetical protein